MTVRIRASKPRKSNQHKKRTLRSISVRSNVITIRPQIIKAYQERYWELEVKHFLNSVTDRERSLITQAIHLATHLKPKLDPKDCGLVIPFPSKQKQ